MPKIHVGSTRIPRLYVGSTRVKKAYVGSSLVYADEQSITAPSGVSVDTGRPYELKRSATNYTEYFDVTAYDNISGSITCQHTAWYGSRPYGAHGTFYVILYDSSGNNIASKSLGVSTWGHTETNTGTFSFSLTNRTGNYRIGIYCETRREASDSAQQGTMSGSISSILMKTN